MKSIRLLAILLMCIQMVGVKAQHHSAYAEVYDAIDTSRMEGDIMLRIVDQNFFKNDEYFSDYIEGYTLVGYRLQPSVTYYMFNNVCIEAGVQILQYGGTDRLDKVYPMVNAKWQINRTWQMVMGMIDGHMSHNLHESMWEPERQLTDKPETGVQMKVRRPHLDGEVWMNWQQFIKRGDTIPEKFTVGISADIKPGDGKSGWKMEIPVRLLVSHVGGQISDFSERMQSLANGSASLIIGYGWGEGSINRLYFDLHGQFFHAMVDGGVRPFSDGGAIHPQIGVKTRLFDANVGFWHAKNYFSLYGNPTFMSLSNYNSDVYSKNRNMLTMEANFNYGIGKNLRLSIGGKGYYDTDASQMDYSYHVDFVVSPRWKIGNVGRNSMK